MCHTSLPQGKNKQNSIPDPSTKLLILISDELWDLSWMS